MPESVLERFVRRLCAREHVAMMHFPHGLRGFVSALASRFAEDPRPRRDGPVEPLLASGVLIVVPDDAPKEFEPSAGGHEGRP